MADARLDTPEAAALAGWSQTPNAAPRLVQVTVRGQRVEVVLDLEPAYREWVSCVHGPGGWRTTVGGNGPTPNWDDVDACPREP